jgi:hypothetical protein
MKTEPRRKPAVRTAVPEGRDGVSRTLLLILAGIITLALSIQLSVKLSWADFHFELQVDSRIAAERGGARGGPTNLSRSSRGARASMTP